MLNGISELKEYVGDRWQGKLAGGRDTSVGTDFENFMALGKTPEEFYRESEALLYHLAYFGEDIWKAPYHTAILKRFSPPMTIVEYGCGVGTDGLKFSELGFDVSFVDYQSRCTEFLEWRLEQRGLELPIYEHGDSVAKADLVFAFDVIEHTEEQLELLQQIETYGRIVVVNLLKHITGTPLRSGYRLHYPCQIKKLFEHIESKGEILEKIDFDYAWLLIYYLKEDQNGKNSR